MKGDIKVTAKIFPPSVEPMKVEYEQSWGVQEFEDNFKVPKLSKFNPMASPASNFRKVILRKGLK